MINPKKKRHVHPAYVFCVAYEIMTAATLSDQAAGFLSHPYPLICARFHFCPLNDKIHLNHFEAKLTVIFPPSPDTQSFAASLAWGLKV